MITVRVEVSGGIADVTEVVTDDSAELGQVVKVVKYDHDDAEDDDKYEAGIELFRVVDLVKKGEG